MEYIIRYDCHYMYVYICIAKEGLDILSLARLTFNALNPPIVSYYNAKDNLPRPSLIKTNETLNNKMF